MPYYRVFIEANGIKVVDLDDGPPIIGFFATRVVRADSVSEAEERAKVMVLTDWTTGKYSALNTGNKPALRVDRVYASSWWEYFRFRNKGHLFFTEDENAEQVIPADRGEERRSR